MENQPGVSRKKFISSIIAGAAISAVAASPMSAFLTVATKYKAVAFDAFAIFDARPVGVLAETFFPGKGKELITNWRTAQFDYCWLRANGKRYKNFSEITKDALVVAAKKTGVQPSAQEFDQLLQQYHTLPVWPDVIPALEKMKQQKIQVVFLSNMTKEMLQRNSEHNKIEKYFDHVISTDEAKTYKPDPKAYQLGVDTCKLKKNEILFVAFAGWDAAGSVWFGYPTYWLNRAGSVEDELDAKPGGVGKTMDELERFMQL